MLVIAAAVCGIKLVRSYNSSNKDLVEELEVSAPTYDPSGQVVADNFRNNILVIVADENRSESQLMFVLNVDSATNSLNFLFLPSELKFNIASGRTVGSFGSRTALPPWRRFSILTSITICGSPRKKLPN